MCVWVGGWVHACVYISLQKQSGSFLTVILIGMRWSCECFLATTQCSMTIWINEVVYVWPSAIFLVGPLVVSQYSHTFLTTLTVHHEEYLHIWFMLHLSAAPLFACTVYLFHQQGLVMHQCLGSQPCERFRNAIYMPDMCLLAYNWSRQSWRMIETTHPSLLDVLFRGRWDCLISSGRK